MAKILCGFRLREEIISFIHEIAPEYSSNMSEFISDIFYFALYGANPENGNNIKQFFDDVRDGKWIGNNPHKHRIQIADDRQYAAFSSFMSEYSDGDMGLDIIRSYILSELPPRDYWRTNMSRLTAYLKIIVSEYDQPLMIADFIRYFTIWMKEFEQTENYSKIKKDVINELYDKHHPLSKFTEEEA